MGGYTDGQSHLEDSSCQKKILIYPENYKRRIDEHRASRHTNVLAPKQADGGPSENLINDDKLAVDDDRLTDNDCTADNFAADNKKPELRKNEEKVSRQTIKLYIDESKGNFYNLKCNCTVVY